MPKYTKEEQAAAEKWLREHGIEIDERGYTQSGTRCEGCGELVWVKSTTKPFRWESDVRITTFNYECRSFGSHWTEHDSD